MNLSNTHPADQSRDILACESSLHVGEDLFASAPRADTWLLLEHTGPWGAKALPESDLPEPLKQQLSTWLDTIPASRFQFIRQFSRSSESITFYIALANELKPVLYEFALASYEELLTLDLSAIISGDAAYDDHIRDESIFLVCTNGKRDQCCAKLGVVICQTMTALAGEAAWQTTHLGGHRFAATAAFLPQGIMYGRLKANDVETVYKAHRSGHIHLEKYRGCSYYSPVAQAADYYLRQQSGITQLGQFHLVSVEQIDQHESLVDFVTADGATYRLRILRETSEFRVRKSTRKDEWSQVSQYQLLKYEVIYS